jgi:hypothetical protein
VTSRLLITRRRVPLDRLDEYDSGWDLLRRAVTDAGGRAWRYRASHHDDQFIEFLECDDTIAPSITELPGAHAAMQELDAALGPGTADEWEESRPEPP